MNVFDISFHDRSHKDIVIYNEQNAWFVYAYYFTAIVELNKTLFYWQRFDYPASHYRDVIMSPMASQITSLTIVNSTVYSGADQRKHQSSASLAFVRGIHRWPVNSPHKWPVTRKMFPFDDVIIGVMAYINDFIYPCKIVVYDYSSMPWNQQWFNQTTVEVRHG